MKKHFWGLFSGYITNDQALEIFQGIVPSLHLGYDNNMAPKKKTEPLFQDSFLKYMMVHILKGKENASGGGQREEGRKKREGGHKDAFWG